MKRFPIEDDDDAFDERGVLKDGKSFRTPMYLMDAMQRDIAMTTARITDASGNGGFALNRPGYRISTNDAGRDARRQAYDAYDADMATSWRGSAGEGTKAAKVALPTMDARTAAYAQYDREISEQWKGASR